MKRANPSRKFIPSLITYVFYPFTSAVDSPPNKALSTNQAYKKCALNT